ncbi:MAG: hypothetical protein ACHQF3_07725 [Alphaproteobacteria bacterium]
MPDDVPLPLAKPALPEPTRTALIGAETLQLEFLPLPRTARASAPAEVVPFMVRSAAASAPAPARTPPVQTADAVALLSLELHPSAPSAMTIASRAEALPFSDPLILPVTVDGGAGKGLRFEVPRIGNMTIVPSLQVLGLPPVNASDVRISAPHDPRFNPSPGLDAVVDLGQLTLDARLIQPLRAADTRGAPDTRYLGDRGNIGVDMKLKF